MITTPEQMREAAARDNDLIRRGNVTAIPLLGMTVTQIERAIRAIPIAPQPVADDFDGLQNKMLDMIEANIDTMKLALETAGERIAELEAELAACKTHPVAVTVKPLVWEDIGNGRAYRAACPIFGSIRVESYGFGDFHVLWSTPGFCDGFTPGLYKTAELAKAAAQADYEARILSDLTIHPVDPMSDPLSDPRVVALVEAAKDLADVCSVVGVSSSPSLRRMRAALRAIGGEA